jgi:hypothetical protein
VFFLDHKYANSVVAYSKAEKLAALSEPDQFTMAMAFEQLHWAMEVDNRRSRLVVAEGGNSQWMARGV